MAETALKLTSIVGEIFWYHYSQMAEIALELSTMVGEMFFMYE